MEHWIAGLDFAQAGAAAVPCPRCAGEGREGTAAGIFLPTVSSLHGHMHHLTTHTCRAEQAWTDPYSGELCGVMCDVLCQPASSTILALRRVMMLEHSLLEGLPT